MKTIAIFALAALAGLTLNSCESDCPCNGGYNKDALRDVHPTSIRSFSN